MLRHATGFEVLEADHWGERRRLTIKVKLRIMAGEMRRSARETSLPGYMKMFEHAAEDLEKKATELDAKKKHETNPSVPWT